MSHKKFNQKGFTAIEALLIIIIVAILGGTGYFVYHANKKTNDILTTPTHTLQNKPLVSSTANWTSYNSPDGKFNLKYPKTWAPASDPNCTQGPSTLLLAPVGSEKASVGTCPSDNFSQITVASAAGDYRSTDISNDTTYRDIKTKALVVSGVQGKRTQGTFIIKNSPESELAVYPSGTRVVEYTFFDNNRTYTATYVQRTPEPNPKDALDVFDLMITTTLKFQ